MSEDAWREDGVRHWWPEAEAQGNYAGTGAGTGAATSGMVATIEAFGTYGSTLLRGKRLLPKSSGRTVPRSCAQRWHLPPRKASTTQALQRVPH